MEGDGCFVREVEIDSCPTPLRILQKEVGDVSCVVWDAALVLTKYLDKCDSKKDNGYPLSGKNIVELGAGTGCVGLTAACLGGNVTMTDLPEVMDLLKTNIRENKNLIGLRGGIARAKILDWGKDLECWEKPALLLMADCIYYAESIEPLVQTMKSLSNEDTDILLCQEERISDKQIQVWKDFQVLVEQDFNVIRIPESEQHETFCSSDICIMRLKKKACTSNELAPTDG